MKKTVRTEEIRLQTIEIIELKIAWKLIIPVEEIPAKIEETNDKIPIEMTGEKSRFPILKNPRLEKKFKYGSQIFEITFPKLVYFPPGNQLNAMSTKQRIV